ncbi:MAG: hypothetical protein WCS52_06005 [bacterium]
MTHPSPPLLTIFSLGLAFCLLPLLPARGTDPADANILLANTLGEEGHHTAAAVEFRRLALLSPAPSDQASFSCAAAYEYQRAGDILLAEKMLDQAENEYSGITPEILLFRGKNAMSAGNWTEASFYFQGLTQGATQPVTRLASRSLAVTQLHLKDPAGAKKSLTESPGDETEGLKALEHYSRGSDKSPRIGGLLGMIPGMGYAYSGEYPNAARSLILNGIFIFGMVSTAEEDLWGAFTVISFFEVTWYSGSIYGGVDAANRYNQNRLDTCTSAIYRESQARPDYTQLPLLRLQYKF